jgi:hypothetical protein
LLILISSPLSLNLQTVDAQETQDESTLAEVITDVAKNIQTTDSALNAIFGQIFGLNDRTVFDNAIQQVLNNNLYPEVIFVARLAELNNYSSPIIDNCTKTALQNIAMCGSLPITSTGSRVPDSFSVYDRYMINAYRYAQELNVSGWDINQAYQDFVQAYLKPPANSHSGEMLWISPKDHFTESFSSRYYDEHAQTLGMFLEFANSISDAMNYADDAWLNLQPHWNGNYYIYSDSSPQVECEMGNFAQIIAQYRNSRGEIPYFNCVVDDLQYKLLSSEFNSSGWGTTAIVKHADTNPQLRLGETFGAVTSLQMLYPNFTSSMQANFRNMLNISWQGLVNSSLFSDNKFRSSDTYGDTDFNDQSSLLALMLLFLYGIIPDTGYLAITASNERYQDYQTCFNTSQWKFDYVNSSIRIPVIQGNLTFIFGTQNVSQDFPLNGVYDIQFRNDWNSIHSTTKVADINVTTLEPVSLEPIPRQQPTSTPTASPQPTATPASDSSPTPIPILTPALTPIPTPTVEPQLSPTNQEATSTPTIPTQNPILPYESILIVLISSVLIITLGAYYVKSKASKKTSSTQSAMQICQPKLQLKLKCTKQIN